MIDDLYRQYGELMIQAEILQARLNAVKQRLIEELNKPKDEAKEEKE
jgi:hypothetical protein